LASFVWTGRGSYRSPLIGESINVDRDLALAADALSCGAMTDQAEAVLSLEPARINALLQSGEAVVIDIRRDYEYEAGHVPGSRHIEINDVSANADSIPRDRTIVFYCRSGNRSGMPAEAFRQAGYEAYNMEGGLTAWVEAGLPLEPEGGEIAQPLPV